MADPVPGLEAHQEALLAKARHEAAEDRRIDHLMHDPKNRKPLLQRAEVTDALADALLAAWQEAQQTAAGALSEHVHDADTAYDGVCETCPPTMDDRLEAARQRANRNARKADEWMLRAEAADAARSAAWEEAQQLREERDHEIDGKLTTRAAAALSEGEPEQ